MGTDRFDILGYTVTKDPISIDDENIKRIEELKMEDVFEEGR